MTHRSAQKSASLSRTGAAVLALLLAGCGGSGGSPTDATAAFQPEISNRVDSFEYQVTGVRNVSTTQQYQWQNTGTVANVNQSSAVTAGTATLILRDPAGGQVYSRDLKDNGTFVTSRGTSGTWTIQVVLSNVSGTLNFRVQKP